MFDFNVSDDFQSDQNIIIAFNSLATVIKKMDQNRLVSSHVCRISDDKTFVNCSYLKLKQIPKHFPKNVKRIDLSNNYIETVPNKAFHKLSLLKYVTLDNNNIKRLNSKAFTGSLALEYLSLKNNKLTLDNVSFRREVFKPLTKLRTLDISNNVKGDCEQLKMSQHQRYPDVEFGYLRNLQRLSMDLYPLPLFGEEFHMTNCIEISSRVGIAAFNHFTRLRVFNLRSTQISIASALALLYAFRNRTMDVNSNLLLNGNQDAVILTENNTVYLKSICVKKFNIGFNAIVQLKRKSLFELSRFTICVEHLILSGNSFHSISDLETEIIALLFFASKLHLQTIEYSYAPVEYPVYYVTPSRFAIENNGNLSSPASFMIDSGCKKKLAILLPPRLKNIFLSHVIGYVDLCNITLYTNNIQTIDISYTLLQSPQIEINGLRWRILYFFNRHCYSGYKHLGEAEGMQYDYDAFVAYSGDEYEWICSKFRKTLEVENSLKLCLHDRDFAVGESILQNIINSISRSRKVIIDATPGYLRSRWCELEVEMTKLEMFDRPYENGIIVIVRNGTKPSDMPSLLKSIWNSITCVIFDEGDTENTFFQRLLNALKD
ncbi:hypothetical protein KUTeg_007829 [Tegillarca granosa]|uniref:TIR domain-containing protein n=1 Tax=Tegillarca granosa TaxID=220873 RepID=A0ABQ9FEG1_TEGGR|nr:hypothetical protein KUTeg_007829 [Tegillarca granosa]